MWQRPSCKQLWGGRYVLCSIQMKELSNTYELSQGSSAVKKIFSKIILGIGITIVAIPVFLIALFIVIEIVGYIANHAATSKQTKELTTYIESSIEDASIIDTYSFTGNTSGTSNYVECKSKITFISDMAKEDVDRIFKARYMHCELEKNDGTYIITVYGDVPFPDNIEGH